MSTTLATKRFVFGDVGHFLAFGFGLGLTPKAPGTAGTLAAIPLYWMTLPIPIFVRFIFAALLFIVGVWLCGRTGKALGRHDDSGIVWDEIAAFYVVLLAMPTDWRWLAVAFVLFRFFDAAKPPPINWLDKNIGGGWGVMIDDMAAAAVTIAVLLLGKMFLL